MRRTTATFFASGLIQNKLALPILLLSVFALTASMPELTEALQLERDAIVGGQWYRLLSAHFVHANIAHALANAIATVVVFLLFHGVISPLRWLLSIVICAVSISVLLLVFTAIDWYLGFSGVLHGMVAIALTLDRRLSIVLRVVLLAGLVGKVANELFGTGATSSALLEITVVSEAHAFGIVTGALIAPVMRWLPRGR